jgi:hypothetical protein
MAIITLSGLFTSTALEQVVAGFEITAALDQFQRSEPAQDVVETTSVDLVAGRRNDLLLVQPGG